MKDDSYSEYTVENSVRHIIKDIQFSDFMDFLNYEMIYEMIISQ